jgi:hypothetical protein
MLAIAVVDTDTREIRVKESSSTGCGGKGGETEGRTLTQLELREVSNLQITAKRFTGLGESVVIVSNQEGDVVYKMQVFGC